MKLKTQVVLRNIAGEDILIPVGGDVTQSDRIFALNETSAAAVKALINGGDENDMLKAVLDEFDVDEAVAKQDIAELIERLKEFGLI